MDKSLDEKVLELLFPNKNYMQNDDDDCPRYVGYSTAFFEAHKVEDHRYITEYANLDGYSLRITVLPFLSWRDWGETNSSVIAGIIIGMLKVVTSEYYASAINISEDKVAVEFEQNEE